MIENSEINTAGLHLNLMSHFAHGKGFGLIQKKICISLISGKMWFKFLNQAVQEYIIWEKLQLQSLISQEMRQKAVEYTNCTSAEG